MAEGIPSDTSRRTVELTSYKPQPGPQLAAYEATFCFEIMYGGARGGGKSIFLLLDFLQDVPTYGDAWHGILVRHTFKQLEQVIKDSYKIFPATGAMFEKQPRTWHWPNGASLKFRNLETVADTEDYQGHSYPWVGMDEAGNYPDPDVYFRMLATCRSGDRPIPTRRARLTANPGGVGHHWIKTRYIDPAPSGYVPIATEVEGGTRERMYIPSRFTDNKIMMLNDPFYTENLKLQASPELIRAWLEGDWDVQMSAFFTEFDKEKHVMKPFPIPNAWYKFRSFDWGSAHPFCVLWFAVADGRPIEYNNEIILLPKGCLVCYREWYGMVPGKPNVGIGLNNEGIAAGIIRMTGDEEIGFTTTDSLPFQDRGGIKMAETFYRNGVPLKRGDTSRVPGWQQVRSRLVGTAQGPLMVFFDTCIHTIRTLPALQPDKHNFEDVNSDLEDHSPDSVRLACMERPIVRKRKTPVELKPLNEMTFDELLKQDEYDRDN